jgi:hypothetical protein
MKTTLLFHCALVLLFWGTLPTPTVSQTVQDQSFRVEWTQEFRHNGWNLQAAKSIYFEDGSSLIYGPNLAEEPSKFYFQLFDDNHALVKEGELSLKINGGWLLISDFAFFGDEIRLLASKKVKGEKSAEIYLVSVHPKTFEISGEPHLIGEVPLQSRLNSLKAEFDLSPDKSRLLVSANYQERLLTRESIQFIWVFDQNLEEQWRHQSDLPFSKTNAVFTFWINNEGTLFGFATRNEDEDWGQWGWEKTEYGYLALRLSSNMDAFHINPIDLGGKRISGFFPAQTREGQLLLIGIYKGERGARIQGLFYYILDPVTLELVREESNDFEDSFLRNRFNSYHSWTRAYETTPTIFFEKIVTFPNGSRMIIAETHDAPFLNEILVFYINPEGAISWSRKIHKRQQAATGYGSYFLATGADRISIVFGDDDHNYRSGEVTPGHGYDGKHCVVVIVEVFPSGEMTTSILSPIKDKSKLSLVPHLSGQLDNGQLFLLQHSGGKCRIGEAVIDLEPLNKG